MKRIAAPFIVALLMLILAIYVVHRLLEERVLQWGDLWFSWDLGPWEVSKLTWHPGRVEGVCEENECPSFREDGRLMEMKMLKLGWLHLAWMRDWAPDGGTEP